MNTRPPSDVRFRFMADPAPGATRKRSQFRSSNAKVLGALRSEIFKLGATSIVVEAGYDEDQIRNDGWPYSSAKNQHPAVRISFKGRHGPMAFTCGTYATLDENLYAIALTLEALRAMERYGAVKGAQQYAGWKQLPPPPGTPGGGPTGPHSANDWAGPVHASNFLRQCAGRADELHKLEGGTLDIVYREAAKKHHPDGGGRSGLMPKINSARDYLEKHA